MGLGGEEMRCLGCAGMAGSVWSCGSSNPEPSSVRHALRPISPDLYGSARLKMLSSGKSAFIQRGVSEWWNTKVMGRKRVLVYSTVYTSNLGICRTF